MVNQSLKSRVRTYPQSASKSKLPDSPGCQHEGNDHRRTFTERTRTRSEVDIQDVTHIVQSSTGLAQPAANIQLSACAPKSPKGPKSQGFFFFFFHGFMNETSVGNMRSLSFFPF